MKVLNLQCASMHTFEGWFGSEEDYQSQRERGLVACPLCERRGTQIALGAPLEFWRHCTSAVEV